VRISLDKGWPPPVFCLGLGLSRSGLFLVITAVLISFDGSELRAADSVDPNAATNAVDFDRDIRGIFGQHCIACHGPVRQKGSLRLDLYKEAKKPLASGNLLFDPDLEVSELYHRITSDDPDIQMPKDRPPLRPDQIALIGEWLKAGAVWGDDPETEDGPAIPVWLADWGRFIQPVRPFGVPLVAGLLLWLIGGRLIQRKESGTAFKVGSYLRSRLDVLLLLVLAAGFAGKFLQARRTNELAPRRLDLIYAERREEGKVRWASHPPRMVGIYYRGNDERTETLYNGGYYCTCTMEVSLWQGNQRLEWGSPVAADSPLFIELVIERTPYSTPGLFTDNAMLGTFLSWDRESQIPKSEVGQMQVLESAERWRAILPIGDRTEGLIFLRKGVQRADAEVTSGSPHYAIGFSVDRENGLISRESFVRMGSIYHTDKIVILEEDEIPLNEWFDFRPMPMIEGGNTTDPKALGLEDHVAPPE